jgi:D-alanyl-D-alanine carboxypeptidase
LVVVLLMVAFVVGGLLAVTIGRDDAAQGRNAPVTTASSDVGAGAPADGTIIAASDPSAERSNSGDGTMPDTSTSGAGDSAADSVADTALDTQQAAADSAPGVTTEVAPATAPPEVDAAAYVVFDATNGVRLASKNADQQLAIGSLFKLLTAYVVMEAGEPEKEVVVPPLQVDQFESQIGLIAGERLSRAVLMRAMLIVSGNDAARVLATDVAGSEAEFVTMMNAAAGELGLTDTRAANVVGLDDPAAHSTANDVLVMARELMSDPVFRETAARPSAKLHGAEMPATNDLLRTYEGADGIKTGRTTDAGYCIAGSATREGRSVYVVVLGSSSDDTRLAASTALLDWAFAQPAS